MLPSFRSSMGRALHQPPGYVRTESFQHAIAGPGCPAGMTILWVALRRSFPACVEEDSLDLRSSADVSPVRAVYSVIMPIEVRSTARQGLEPGNGMQS